MSQSLTAKQHSKGWLLDDGTYLTASESAPVEVIRRLHAYAVVNHYAFPVHLIVEPYNGFPIYLYLALNGSTQPAPAPAPEEVADSTADNDVSDEGIAPSLGDDLLRSQDSQVAATHKRPLNRKVGLIGSLTLASLLIAATVGFMLISKVSIAPEETTAATSELSDTATPVLYDIPAHEKPLNLVGTTLIGVEGNNLRLTNITNGDSELATPFEVEAGKVRTQTNGNTTAVDSGQGKVLFINGQEQKTVKGLLNTRGTSPVVVSEDFTKYTLPQGEEQDVPENSAVLGATDKNIVFVKAPATIEYSNDHRTVEVTAPTEDAILKAWIAATEDYAVSVWGTQSTTWLVVTDTHRRETSFQEEILSPESVSYLAGKVIIDGKKYLSNNLLHEICQPGKWIGGQRWCETNGQWSNGETTLDEEPTLITDKYIITNQQVKENS